MKRDTVRTQTFYVDLGERIAKWRRAEGILTAALARRVGVTPRTMQRIESGEIHCKVHVLLAIAETLDLSFDFDIFPVMTADERKSA